MQILAENYVMFSMKIALIATLLRTHIVMLLHFSNINKNFRSRACRQEFINQFEMHWKNTTKIDYRMYHC